MKSFALLFLTIGLVAVSHSYAQELMPQPVQKTKKIKREQKEIKEAPAFLIGVESKNYTYTEPGVVKHSGFMFGVWGEWKWTSFIGDGKIYGDLAYGLLKYDGSACSTTTGNCTPLEAPTSDIIGRLNSRLDVFITPNFEVFGGVGYRYLFDRGQGGSFYDRTGQWLFLPVGVAFNFATSLGQAIFDAEYDVLLQGTFDSKLSQAVPTAPDLHHDQNNGYGVTVNAGLEFGDYKLLGFYELWKLDRTDSIQGFYEPANNSESYGLKLGYKF